MSVDVRRSVAGLDGMAESLSVVTMTPLDPEFAEGSRGGPWCEKLRTKSG